MASNPKNAKRRAGEHGKHRCGDEEDARRLVRHHGEFRQRLPQLQPALAAHVLNGVPHFVRRHRDRRNAAPVVMIRAQPHHARVRVVVVAERGLLDADAFQPVMLDEMPRQFPAGARQIGTFGAVLRHLLPDPQLRTERQRQQQGDADDAHERHQTLSKATGR